MLKEDGLANTKKAQWLKELSAQKVVPEEQSKSSPWKEVRKHQQCQSLSKYLGNTWRKLGVIALQWEWGEGGELQVPVTCHNWNSHCQFSYSSRNLIEIFAYIKGLFLHPNASILTQSTQIIFFQHLPILILKLSLTQSPCAAQIVLSLFTLLMALFAVFPCFVIKKDPITSHPTVLPTSSQKASGYPASSLTTYNLYSTLQVVLVCFGFNIFQEKLLNVMEF